MTMEERGETEEKAGQAGQAEEEEMGKMVNVGTDSDDGSSPRGVLEIPVMGGDSSSSSSSSASDNSSSFSSNSSEKSSIIHLSQHALIRDSVGSQWKTMVDMLKKKSAKKFSHIPLFGHYELSKKNLRRKLGRVRSAEEAVECAGIPIPKPSWRNFYYSELANATDNFSSEKLIGKGGHAEVYKGLLNDGRVVAVKKIMKHDNKEEEDRIGDFLTELGIIAHIDHQNAARLLGFSTDGGLHLVLQLLPHGSLASALHGSTVCLEWKIRFKVAIGVAEGLKYLHYECPRRIIHRDIKASNILLAEDYEAQISDFGLAKWLPEKWAHHIVFPIEGTFGYLAPEYFMHGIVDERTDVFAYGVLLLEIITGRHAVDSTRQSLVIWAKPLLDSNDVKELVDPQLGEAYEPSEMKSALLTASLCINYLPDQRPSMKRVVQILKGADSPIEVKQKSNGGKSVVLDGCDLQDYTSSSYIDVLDRHRQLALG